LAFYIPNDVKQDLGMAPIVGFGRLIDHLLNDGQELGDFPTPAVLDDDDALVQRLRSAKSSGSWHQVGGPKDCRTGLS
jgi:hypothetical protein